MQHLKTLSLVILFAVLSVSLAVALSSISRDRIKAFERTQASRSRIQAQIHDTLNRRYAAQILETRLLGRCGITAYIVTLRDAAGNESTLYFDIDNGAPIHHDLLNGCPQRLSGAATPGAPAPNPAHAVYRARARCDCATAAGLDHTGARHAM